MTIEIERKSPKCSTKIERFEKVERFIKNYDYILVIYINGFQEKRKFVRKVSVI